MITFYLGLNGFKINTGEIYRCIVDNSEQIPDSLINTFRNQLKEYLIEKEVPEVKFHPTNWEYHRDKFQNYANSLKNNNPLIPNFFLNQISFDSDTLSDDDKLKTVWKPKSKTPDLGILFGEKPSNSSKEFKTNLKVSGKSRQQILDNFSQGLGSRSDKNAPMNINVWRNWCYDIYSYGQNTNIPFSPNDDSFLLFLTWRLVLTNPIYFRKGVILPLLNHFNLKKEWLADYLTLIEVKYPQIIALVNWSQITLLVMKSLITHEEKVLNTPEVKVELIQKNQTNYIKIKKNAVRGDKDGLTALTRDETIHVFKLLQQNGLILGNQQLSNASLSKLIMGLTAFSSNQVAEIIPNDSLTKVQKENIKEFFLKITDKLNNL